MAIIITQVDSFTDTPFSGNPAGVCVLESSADEKWMQNVAREMNLSETAFLTRRNDGSYDLRWFTPGCEVDLCGHATLASAHVLWERNLISTNDTAVFHTLSGELRARRDGEWIEMDFPSEPAKPCLSPSGLEKALGAKFEYCGRNRMDYLIDLDSPKALIDLKPDFTALKKIESRGFIITVPSESPEYDFLCRFFAPGVGIDEDPVTGSAFTCLAPYWKSRLKKESLTAYQASSRGGIVKVRTSGDRVFISGKAVTVMNCELVV